MKTQIIDWENVKPSFYEDFENDTGFEDGVYLAEMNHQGFTKISSFTVVNGKIKEHSGIFPHYVKRFVKIA